MDCLSDGKDLQNSFLHCGGTVMLVQASLGVKKVRESTFHHCGGPVKLVPACLTGRNDRESRFHH